jgi:hypothetical protein
MGDVGQYDRNVQNVQPPTVTGKHFKKCWCGCS